MPGLGADVLFPARSTPQGAVGSAAGHRHGRPWATGEEMILQMVLSPDPWRLTPNTGRSDATGGPSFRSRSNRLVPWVRHTMAPQVPGPAVLDTRSLSTQRSVVRSAASTSTAGPGALVTGASTAFFTLSRSGAATLLRKNGGHPCAFRAKGPVPCMTVVNHARRTGSLGPVARTYICRISNIMSDHHHEGHFPEEAEQNEIGGPVVLALMILASIVLMIWAAS